MGAFESIVLFWKFPLPWRLGAEAVAHLCLFGNISNSKALACQMLGPGAAVSWLVALLGSGAMVYHVS